MRTLFLIILMLVFVASCTSSYKINQEVYLVGVYTPKPYFVRIKTRNLYYIEYVRRDGSKYGFWVREERLTPQRQDLVEFNND